MDGQNYRLLPKTQVSAVVSLVRPVSVVNASTSCEDVDVMMRRDEEVNCVAVRGDDGRLGLLSRRPFQQSMVGPLGYGRVLTARRPISDLTDWRPVLVGHDAEVSDVATLVLTPEGMHEVSDVLVFSRDGSLGHIPVTSCSEPCPRSSLRER